MDKKYLILILAIVIIAIVALAGAYLLNNQEENYHRINLSSSCSILVPDSQNATNTTDYYNIFHYMDSENQLDITFYNSYYPERSLSGAAHMAAIRDSTLGLTVVEENNITVYLNESTGVYSYFVSNNITHDNILITCSDLDMLMTIINSITFNNGTGEFNNMSVNHSSSQQIDSSLNSSSSSSTPPGDLVWNSQNGDWMYEETLDDGNVRQYDSQGNLIGSTLDEDQEYLANEYSRE